MICPGDLFFDKDFFRNAVFVIAVLDTSVTYLWCENGLCSPVIKTYPNLKHFEIWAKSYAIKIEN